MFTLAEILIYCLAVWRVSSLFVRESGPAFVFKRLREKAGIVHDGEEVALIPDTFFAQVLSCVWCFSIWAAFFWTAFWLVSPEWSLKLAVPFALSGGAILLDRHVNA
jgi:hypothetical protein